MHYPAGCGKRHDRFLSSEVPEGDRDPVVESPIRHTFCGLISSAATHDTISYSSILVFGELEVPIPIVVLDATDVSANPNCGWSELK